MKVLDADKVIALMERAKMKLPGKSGILPNKFFTRENMDYLIEGLQNNAVDLDILANCEIKDSGLLLVGFDHFHEDIAVLVIGYKAPDGSVQIVNQFQGEEAEALYKKLVERGKS